MKKTLASFALACFSITFALAQKNIEIQNPSASKRLELVSIPYSDFSKHFLVDSIFSIKDKKTGVIYPYQLEMRGHDKPQNILIQVQIEAKAKLNLLVIKEKYPTQPSQTYARYVPERLDDFAWENNVIAFRMYGKALEGRPDDAQGIDVWVKRTPDLVINNWYKSNDYHKDHGQGLDYYSVGQTLGAGDMAIYLNNKLSFTKHYRSYKILDNGPLRTTFVLEYEPQDIVGNSISLTKTITIDADQNFNKITVNLKNANPSRKSTPIAIGLVKRNESSPEVAFNSNTTSLAYWEPAVQDNGHTGTAIILPKQKVNYVSDDTKQFLVLSSIENNQPFTYYNGAAWSKAGYINNAKDWQNFVSDFATKTQTPLTIKLKQK